MIAKLVALSFVVAVTRFNWPGLVKGLFVLVAAYLLLEVLLSRSRVVFEVDEDAPLASAKRTLLLGLLNVLEVWLLFAVLAAVYVQVAPGAFLDETHQPLAFDQTDRFLYLSWTTLLTMGSGYVPVTPWARTLITAELGMGLFLIVITIAATLSAVKVHTKQT